MLSWWVIIAIVVAVFILLFWMADVTLTFLFFHGEELWDRIKQDYARKVMEEATKKAVKELRNRNK